MILPPGALPLHLPDLAPAATLSADLAGTRPLCDRLLADLALHDGSGAPQHHLLVGGPGAGKSTLLRLLAARVTAELGDTWRPVLLGDGWPRVSSLASWWTAVLAALVRSLDPNSLSPGDPALAARVREGLAALPDPEGDRSHQALQLVRASADHLGRHLALLVDDAGQILGRLQSSQWALREVLSTEPRLALLAAASPSTDLTVDYGAAFYDFFVVSELPPLDLAAALALVRHRAAAAGLTRALRVAERHPRRLEATLTLLRPTPWVVTALTRALALDPAGDAASDLLRVLDLAGPACTARLQALPDQAQQVALALAAAWDPAPAADLAVTLGLPVNTVSSQLSRLAQQGLVEKVPLPPGARLGFQLADRRLALWVLAASEALRAPLVSLAHALERGGRPAKDALTRLLPDGPDPAALARLAPERRRAAERLLSLEGASSRP